MSGEGDDDGAITAGPSPPTVGGLLGLSRAHRDSSPFAIDPDYRAAATIGPKVEPRDVGVRWWLYGESECETYRLAVLRRHVREAKLNVYYPGEYALPSRRAYFRADISDLILEIGEDEESSNLTNDATATATGTVARSGGSSVAMRIRIMSNARGIMRLVRQWRSKCCGDDDTCNEEESDYDGRVVHKYGSGGDVGGMEEFDVDISDAGDGAPSSFSSSAATGESGGERNGPGCVSSFILIELETGETPGGEEGEGGGDDIPEPPCLWIDFPSAKSSSTRITEGAWRWSADGIDWTRTTVARSPPSSTPSSPSPLYPHRIDSSPEIRLGPREVVHDVSSDVKDDGREILYDFGVELFGTVLVEVDAEVQVDADADDDDDSSDRAPVSLYVGESKAEVMNDDPDSFEQSTQLIPDGGERRSDDEDGQNLRGDDRGGRDRGEKCGREVGRRRRRYRSRFPLAFRYVRLATTTRSVRAYRGPPDVHVAAQFRPVHYHGAFSSRSRPILNRIWMSSAYTLRTCCAPSGGAFVTDGIKRDRLPWAGDLAVSLLVNRATFADADIVRRTLTVLGRAGIERTHINGIVDYSLWWIICHELYQLHDGVDLDYLEKEWTRIRGALTVLMDRSEDDSGFLELKVRPTPADDDDGEEGGGGVDGEDYDWLFVDWSIPDDRRKVTSVQILFWWALRCGAALASRRRRRPVDTEDSCGDAGDSEDDLDAFVARLERHRDKVRRHLLDVCYDDEAGFWLAYPPLPSCLSSSSHAHAGETNGRCYSRHASILSVVSGLMTETPSISLESKESLKDALLGRGGGGGGKGRLDDDDVVGTPYFKYWECTALFRLGATTEALDVVKKYWGGMVRSGATTFWESYEQPSQEEDGEEDKKHSEMYGRPYGRSLCHAWGAGPCHLLSAELLGLHPLTDGYGEWTIRYPPSLDGKIVDGVIAAGLSVAVPSPAGGAIEIASVRGGDDALNLEVKVPDATSLVLSDGRRFVGPTAVSLPLPGVIDRGDNDDGGGTISDDDVRRYSAEFRGWHYHPDFVIPPSPKIVGFDDDITMTDVPTIYRLPDDGDDVYYMAFVGFDGSGYQSFVARSTDLIHWDDIRLAMRRSDVVDDFDHGGVVLGGFLYEDYKLRGRRTLKRIDDKFWALYGCYSKRGGYEIDPGYEGIAWSVDGLLWERAMDRPILSVHDPDVGSWEKDSIYQPWLMEHGDDGGQYYNFYNAKTLDPQWTEQIGLATSCDMKKWDRQKENPVLRVRPGGYDSRFSADPKVWHDDGEDEKFVMLYFGVDDTWHAHIMIAYSRHLQHGGCWRADQKPLYRAGGNPSGIDGEHAHKASLIWSETDETWYLFYCAVGDSGRGIGLIRSTPKFG